MDEDYETIYLRSPVSHQWFAARKSGKCEFEKCGGVCCTFFFVENLSKHHPTTMQERAYYWAMSGRGRVVDVDGYKMVVMDHNCKQLDATTGKCKSYETRPAECRRWPTINDNMHKVLKDKCTIKITGVHQVPKYKVPKEYKDGKR